MTNHQAPGFYVQEAPGDRAGHRRVGRHPRPLAQSVATGEDPVQFNGRGRRRAVLAAAAVALFALAGCAAGGGESITSPIPTPSVSTPPVTEPTATEPPPTRAELPAPVANPCGLTGKDLADYQNIATSFESYFQTLTTKVLLNGYHAAPADVNEISARAELLVARMRAGDMTDKPDGVISDIMFIADRVEVLLKDKGLPSEPGVASPTEVNAGLDRQEGRVRSVVAICPQQ